MKKTKKRITIVTKVFLILLNVLGLLDIILILKMNVLPLKFLIPIILVFLVFLILLNLLITRKKKKKCKIYVFCTVAIIGLSILCYYLLGTLGFLNSFGKGNYKEESYSLVVLKDTKYEGLKDLNNKKIGLVSIDSKGQNKALKKIKKSIAINEKEYSDSGSLANALLEKQVEAILIDNAQLEMVCENVMDFELLIRILHEETIKIELENKTSEIDVTKDFFNVYISGIDTYGSVNKTSRSDVNLVVSINPETKQVLITSIPRDYYVSLAGKKGLKDKLTHAGIYGVETSMETIANLLDTEIDYYVKVNFSSLVNIVDTLGGIDVNSNYRFTTIDGYTFKKGNNHLNGKKALSFVRERYAFGNIGGDRIRGENQQLVLKALIEKALSPSILVKYNSLLKSVDKSFITNIPDEYITKLINKQLDNNQSWNIETMNLDGSNAYEYTYSYQSQKLYVMIPDEESVKSSQEKIDLLTN